jgi:hypothetical protein
LLAKFAIKRLIEKARWTLCTFLYSPFFKLIIMVYTDKEKIEMLQKFGIAQPTYEHHRAFDMEIGDIAKILRLKLAIEISQRNKRLRELREQFAEELQEIGSTLLRIENLKKQLELLPKL